MFLLFSWVNGLLDQISKMTAQKNCTHFLRHLDFHPGPLGRKPACSNSAMLTRALQNCLVNRKIQKLKVRALRFLYNF
jgi:hypothetical protein